MGIVASGTVVLPVFAQDVPNTQVSVPTIPTVPPATAPSLRGFMGSMGGKFIPGGFGQHVQQGAQGGGSVNEGAWPHSGRARVEGDVGSSTDEVSSLDVQVRPNGEVRVGGMQVGPNGVRVRDMRVASTSDTGERPLRQEMRDFKKKMSDSFLSASTTDGVPFPSFGKASDLTAGFVDGMKKGVQNRIDSMKQRADTEIAKRIDALTALQSRIANMTQLSADDKASLTQDLSTQIASLSTLKDSILADASTTTLKADVQLITKSFRTFALVIPKGAVTAAAGRIESVVTDMQTVGTKLKTLIDAAVSSGADVSVAQSAYSDLVSKLADAQSQAGAARALVADLKPDNGDNTVYQNNVHAIQAAQKNIQASNQDVKDVRVDISKIRKTLSEVAGNVLNGTTTSAVQ